MRAKRILWDWWELIHLTDDFEKIKRYFKELDDEDLDRDYNLWCSVYDQRRYNIWLEMSWDVEIRDNQKDEVVVEEWNKKREWFISMPLDIKPFLMLNETYANEHLHSNY